ncbi:toll-like receptor 2 isoform X2 [Condylostylus longicornis]|uniref:toll-like receptor 2 isoform X2 n=1 Tax=Condylostylus longicornis TaxID=2530218 RepID=UPI00244E28C1|nr:toll-like receptor 2 isoform X2 [Condylostylus longicornis]
MKYYNLFSLLLIFLLPLRSSCDILTTEDNYWKKFDDGEDDYDDYSSEEVNLLQPNVNNSSNVTENYSNTINFTIESTANNIFVKNNTTEYSENGFKKVGTTLQNCPDVCDCDEYLLFANCSNRKLKQIPKNLPIKLMELDLSHNLIKKIYKNDLDYLVNLKKILLANNEIYTIDEGSFKNNNNLEMVDLAVNQIKTISQNTFDNNPNLSILNLSNNAITIPQSGSFINAPILEILVLTNCSINKVYDDTFKNTSGLIKLMLDENDFNKKINTQAFNASLPKLVKLTLPELEQSYILELCQSLQSIDKISFKNFDLSCFEMVAGLSFNESLISSGTQIPVLQKKDINKNQTIMGVAVVSLLIGILCRKDVYGVKTKLCRSKKTRGPAKSDQSKHVEEIPLNKV